MTSMAYLDSQDTTDGLIVYRFMEPRDADQVVKVARRYFRETDWGDYATFDAKAVRNRFDLTVNLNSVKGIVFTVNGKIKGMVTMVYDNLYTKEPIAYLNILYVAPEYRRGPAGRKLMDLAEEVAEGDGCAAIDSNFMSGIDAFRQTFINMFEKRGYTPMWGGRKVFERA